MRILPFCSVFLAALALGGCSDTRAFLGLTNTPPDEFMVVDHPPLSMPPDYELRPPKPGAASPQKVWPSGMAAEALYGKGRMEMVQARGAPSVARDNLSTAERALVAGAGVQAADPHIRSTLDREASQQVVVRRRLIDAILFWREPARAAAPVVDAVAEHQRLKAAQKAKQPVTAGGTPILTPAGGSTIP